MVEHDDEDELDEDEEELDDDDDDEESDELDDDEVIVRNNGGLRSGGFSSAVVFLLHGAICLLVCYFVALCPTSGCDLSSLKEIFMWNSLSRSVLCFFVIGRKFGLGCLMSQ